jgi:hypothetical protein
MVATAALLIFLTQAAQTTAMVATAVQQIITAKLTVATEVVIIFLTILATRAAQATVMVATEVQGL